MTVIFYEPTISIAISKYQVLGIYRKITENYKRTKCMFSGLWFTYNLKTLLFLFSFLKKVILQKRKYSGKANEQSKAGTNSIQDVTWWAVHIYQVPIAKFWSQCHLAPRQTCHWRPGPLVMMVVILGKCISEIAKLLGNSIWERTVRICERSSCEYVKNVRQEVLQAP